MVFAITTLEPFKIEYCILRELLTTPALFQTTESSSVDVPRIELMTFKSLVTLPNTTAATLPNTTAATFPETLEEVDSVAKTLPKVTPGIVAATLHDAEALPAIGVNDTLSMSPEAFTLLLALALPSTAESVITGKLPTELALPVALPAGG